jgi:hypothetical protein
VVLLVLLLLAGPAETISGKYVQHSDEYLRTRPVEPPPLPDPLPADVDALCALIEGGHDAPELFAALGEALLARGDTALAYRAFHRAHRARPRDPEWGTRMQARKYECARVPDAVVAAEEREARVWVAALKEYERERLANGEDPDDLAPFFERYGRPEDNMWKVMRARRLSGAAGIIGFLVGLAGIVFARWLPRASAFVPALVVVLCLVGPALVGRTGLFFWGAGFAGAGTLAVLAFGRRRAA